MIRVILIAALGLALAGCGSTGVRRELVPVQIEASFFDPNLCHWPRIADHVVTGDDLEAAGYDLAGYEAYRCERNARLAAGGRQAEIAKSIQDR